jgi:hypothetical protein
MNAEHSVANNLKQLERVVVLTIIIIINLRISDTNLCSNRSKRKQECTEEASW